MIVAVCGGAPDVGTSTVALNLGRELEGVVVDGDLALAERAGLRGPDFHDVLADRAEPLEAVTDVGSVRLLPCGRSLAGDGERDRAAIESALGAVAREFGHVVVDCPAGTDGVVQALSDGVYAAVIVTTTAHESLVAAARTRRRALETDTPVGAVVLNRSAPSRPAAEGERVRAVERGLGGPVFELTERTTVRVAGTTGRAVRDVAPDSDVSSGSRRWRRRSRPASDPTRSQFLDVVVGRSDRHR